MISYRERIYAQYASRVQDAKPIFDRDAAERWGKGYDHYFRGWLPKSQTAALLDTACGWGRLLHFFKIRGYQRIQGVDISPQQVAIARQVISGVSESDVLRYLENHVNEFDLITALDIVEHFTKDEVICFLDRCRKSLKPGGRLILQTPNAGCPWGAEHRYNDLTHELGFNANALKRLLCVCDYVNVETREMGPIPWRYSWRSSVRWVVWQAIRAGIKVYNLAETGGTGDKIYTRVFLASGVTDSRGKSG